MTDPRGVRVVVPAILGGRDRGTWAFCRTLQLVRGGLWMQSQAVSLPQLVRGSPAPSHATARTRTQEFWHLAPESGSWLVLYMGW